MNKQVIDTKKADAVSNMAIDAQLLENLSDDDLILHLYDWETPSATYGYFIDPYAYLHPTAMQQPPLQLARRPTGGGIIFHLCDFAFSFLLPATHPAFTINTLENYAFVNHVVADAVQSFSKNHLSIELLQNEIEPLDSSCNNFCMAKPTKYDIMIAGQKVGGGAQRRKRQGILHQGTISLGKLSTESLEALLLPGNQIIAAMQQHSCALLGDAFTFHQLMQAKEEFRMHLIASFYTLM